MLVGQPELWEMLARPELRQLRQRIVLRCELRPFSPEETERYVAERLRLAGYTGKGLFKPAALRALHELSGGVPRVINILCDGSLLLGFARDRLVLGPDEVTEVARDLGLAARPDGAPARVETPSRGRRGLFGLLRPRQVRGT
jgi:general secretion pathway protein A